MFLHIEVANRYVSRSSGLRTSLDSGWVGTIATRSPHAHVSQRVQPVLGASTRQHLAALDVWPHSMLASECAGDLSDPVSGDDQSPSV